VSVQIHEVTRKADVLMETPDGVLLLIVDQLYQWTIFYWINKNASLGSYKSWTL